MVKLLVSLTILASLNSTQRIDIDINGFTRAEAAGNSDTTGKSIGINNSCFGNPDTLDGHKVFLFSEINAEFPGGESAYMDYIAKNLKYPAEQKDFQGSIFATFIVDTSGNIRNPCIYKKFHEKGLTPLEREMINLLERMPRWVPARNNGKKVYMRVYLPIRF